MTEIFASAGTIRYGSEVGSAAGAEGQTSAPALPQVGGDPTQRPDGDVTGPAMSGPTADGCCPVCGQRLTGKSRRGRRGASVDVQYLVGELRREGLSLAGVAAELERRGIPTVQGGTVWRPSSVRAVLARAAAST